MSQPYDPLLLERAARVQALVLDVDGVLTDGRLYFTDGGEEIKAFHSRDGLGLKGLMRHGIQVAMITARRSQLLERRARQLTVEHLYQGQEKKLGAWLDLQEKLGLADDAMCYVGDDLIDLPVLQRAGLAVTVADAAHGMADSVHWVTRNRGGRGAVREVCDLILSAHGVYAQWRESFLDDDDS